MNKLMSKYPRLAFYAILVTSFILASGAGRKWAPH
jgi:hypothetical protein